MQIDSDQTPTCLMPDTRRAWAVPRYSKMRAGDAELGPNPDGADEVFTKS